MSQYDRVFGGWLPDDEFPVVRQGWTRETQPLPSPPPTYCPECGARMAPPPQAHVHDEAGLAAMRKNPLLKLLIKPDGTMNPDAPVILGDPLEDT